MMMPGWLPVGHIRAALQCVGPKTYLDCCRAVPTVAKHPDPKLCTDSSHNNICQSCVLQMGCAHSMGVLSYRYNSAIRIPCRDQHRGPASTAR